MKLNTIKKKMKILSVAMDPKTSKGNDGEWLTAILYMRPNVQICAMSELAGCKAPCLNTAGLGGVYPSVQTARQRKTDHFQNDRAGFMAALSWDLSLLEIYGAMHKLKIAVRLNGTSDIAYERIKVGEHENIFGAHPNITFYDYTKHPSRNISGIENYSLTWSYSGANKTYSDLAKKAKAKGQNIAVVFGGPLPDYFLGLPVIDGDKDDRRFLDPDNVVVGLTAKGRAKKDFSGFVVRDLIAVAA